MKLGIIGFILIVSMSHAWAQASKLRPLTGNLQQDFQTATKPDEPDKIKLTGNIEKDMKAIWAKLVAASITDLTYASAMAESVKTPASGVRKQCWDAIIVLNKQANGLDLKNADGTPMVKPDPAFFTNLESLAEVIDNLSPQGALYTSCAGAARLASKNVLQFVSEAVSGIATFAVVP